ncbi:hypothetical protein ACEPPN_000856 [Leptodophora sp. 'Broadleaf-Isolate-01']
MRVDVLVIITTTEADRLLHTISTSITPNGVPINFNERLNTIDTNAASARRLLDTISISVAPDGVPVNLNERLNTIDTNTASARRLLDTISISVAPDGVPVNLNERLNTIDTNTTSARRLLDTISISIAPDGVPVNLNERLDTINDTIGETRIELRAGNFNNAARIVNSSASCCNAAISTFHSINDQRIPNFPATYGHFKRLSGWFTIVSQTIDVYVTNISTLR